MRAGWGIAIVLALSAVACGSYGSRGDYGRGPYDDPYYGGGLSRRDARVLEDEQELEKRRLERLQRERRENLVERQERRREDLESAGEWDTGDARRQRRARQAQNDRFEDQRKELRDYHDREWDRYGY
jgi:hypothetical protein